MSGGASTVSLVCRYASTNDDMSGIRAFRLAASDKLQEGLGLPFKIGE